MTKAILAFAVVGILTFLNPAAAQNAAELREDVDWVIKSIAKDSDGGVILESGEPRSETVDGAPTVVLPKAAFVIRDFGRIELGAVRAVAQQAPAGLRRVTFLLPSGAELRDEGGETTHTLTAATATLTVDYPPTRQRVRAATLTIKDAELGEAQGPGRLAVKSAVATSDMTPAQGELWNGITGVDIEGMVVSPGGPQARATIDKLTIRQETNDVRIEALEALGSSLTGLLPKDDDDVIDHDALLRELTAAIGKHGTLFSGFKQTMRVGGVKIIDPDADVDMRMTGFVLEMEMRGFDKGLIDWRMAAEYAGLDVAQSMIDPSLFLNGLGIDITLKNIPGGDILGILKSSFERTPPGETDDALPQEVQGALIAAKPSLQLTRLALVTQKLTGQAAGRFAFDPQAMMMGEGEALVTFRGLAELAREVRAGKGNIDPMSAEIITTLNKLAKPGKGADGKPTQEMRVQLGKDGNVLVNGKDLASQLAPEPPKQQQRQRRP
jgi:hypothetical protein